MHRTQKGFTLIELLIVIVIIGILASIVLLGVGRVGPAARDARRVADLRQMQNALELYNRRCGYYPGQSNMMGPCGPSFVNISNTPPAAGGPWGVLTTTLGAFGINIPNDPQAPTKTYLYESNGDPATNSVATQYVLGAELEEANSPLMRGAPSVGLFVIDCGTGRVSAGGMPLPDIYCIVF